MLLGVLGVHALVEYPQQYMFFLLPAAFFIGLLEPAGARFVAPAASRVAYVVLLVVGLGALVPVMLDYRHAEVLYYGEAPERQYRADPAVAFKPWGDYGLATLLSIDRNDLPEKIEMHERAMDLLPGDVVLRRQAILLVLAGREADALDTVKRMKVYAEGVDNWPSTLAALYQLCDQQGAPLMHFKGEVIKRYGISAAAAAASDEDDDDDDGDE
jgi:hypothetical protein